MTITVHTATPRDIWPDGSPFDAETEAEIISVARYVITEDDVQRSGMTYAPWYIPYFLAEGVVQKRREVREKLKQRKRQQRLKQQTPPPQPVARGGVHPSAMRWVNWPKPPDVDKIKDVPDRYREHLREWYQERAPGLGVYRPELDDRQTPTIGDVRKVHREVTIALDQAMCTIVYLSKRIKALEERKMPEYRGIWSDAETYPESSLVTSQGSLWISKAQTKGLRPGDGSCWELAAKKGRDGRHAPRDGKDATT